MSEADDVPYVNPATNPVSRWLLRFFWAPVVLSVGIEVAKAVWHENFNAAMAPFRFSIYLLFWPVLWIMSVVLLRRVPELFRNLVDNDVIDVAYAREKGEWLTRSMNGFFPHFFGIFLTVALQVPVWRAWFARYEFATDWPLLMDPGLWLIFYLIGINLWNGAHVGLFLIGLGRGGRFTVRALHPDKSGGLAKAGELCFLSSLVAVLIGTFCVCWYLPQGDHLATYGGILEVGLVTSVILAFLLFLGPLWAIHRSMVRQGKAIDSRFGAINSELARLRQDLVIDGDKMPRDTFVAQVERARFLETVSGGEVESPRWPVPAGVWWRFFTSLAPIAAGIYQFTRGMFDS